MKRLLILLTIIFAFINHNTNADVKDIDHERFMIYLNKYRASYGAKPVVYDVELEKAAKLQAEYNYHNFRKTHNYDQHYNHIYDRSVDRINAVGIPTRYQAYGEICYALLGIDPTKSLMDAAKPLSSIEEKIFEGYKASTKGHAETMREKSFAKVGIYTFYDGRSLYNVVVFLSDDYNIKKPDVIVNHSKPDNVLRMVNEFRAKNKFRDFGKPLRYDKELETLAKNQAIFDMYHQTDMEHRQKLDYDDLLELNPKTAFSSIEAIQFKGDVNSPFSKGLDIHIINLFQQIEKIRNKLLNKPATHIGVFSILDPVQKEYRYVVVVGTMRSDLISRR
jgi:uncharacterized protein YkwD